MTFARETGPNKFLKVQRNTLVVWTVSQSISSWKRRARSCGIESAMAPATLSTACESCFFFFKAPSLVSRVSCLLCGTTGGVNSDSSSRHAPFESHRGLAVRRNKTVDAGRRAVASLFLLLVLGRFRGGGRDRLSLMVGRGRLGGGRTLHSEGVQRRRLRRPPGILQTEVYRTD